MTPATKRMAMELQETQFIGQEERVVKPVKEKKVFKRGPDRDLEKSALVYDLWLQGKTARQIGVEIGMEIQCIYQQIRRLRQRGADIAHRRSGFTAWKNRK